MEGPFGVRRDLAGGLNIVTARLGYLETLGDVGHIVAVRVGTLDARTVGVSFIAGIKQ